jgi:hypothetical protein
MITFDAIFSYLLTGYGLIGLLVERLESQWQAMISAAGPSLASDIT